MSCKHHRKHGTKVDNGWRYDCLDCGYEWLVLDDPHSENDKYDKAQFEAWQRHEKFLKDSGYRMNEVDKTKPDHSRNRVKRKGDW